MTGKKASILSDTDNYFLFSLNAHLASGMSSALFRVKDGPIGMTQGFAIGYAFMYMIDNVSFTFASCISIPLCVYRHDGRCLENRVFRKSCYSNQESPQ